MIKSREDGKSIEKIFNACLIGCGKIAGNPLIEDGDLSSTHMQAINKSNINVDFIVDIDEKQLLKFSKQYLIKNSSSALKEFHQHEIDLFIVCSPDNTHFELLEEILLNSSPKLIFCEKPVCKTQEELDRLIQLSNEKNIPILVNYNRRFLSNMIELKQIIRSMTLGKLEFGRGVYYSGIRHNSSHMLDLIDFLFDKDYEIFDIKNGKFSPYKNDPSYDFSLRFPFTDHGEIEITSFDERNYQVFELCLYFQNAKVSLENFCTSVKIEYPLKNHIDELELSKTHYLNFVKPSFDEAYFKISNYLSKPHENKKLIEEYLIDKKVFLYKIFSLFNKGK